MQSIWGKYPYCWKIISVLLVLLIMTLPNWGQLQKAQDDPETVEQAIIRLIAAHNEEPMAHLEEGQSLHNHSHEEVIDHPERSIPTDKYSTSEVVYNLNFAIEDFDEETDLTVTPVARGLSVENVADDDDPSRALQRFFRTSNLSYTPTFIILDFSSRIFKDDNIHPTIVGMSGSSYTSDRVVFVFEGSDIIGRIVDGTTVTETDPLDIDYDSGTLLVSRCRLVYDLGEDTFSFYYNDTLIGTLSVPSTFSLGDRLLVDLTRVSNSNAANGITFTSFSVSAGNY